MSPTCWWARCRDPGEARQGKARCDLICIGMRGHTELGKALLGSTATKVVHISEIPVLLVK